MIIVTGCETGPEADAARALAQKARIAWPRVNESAEDFLYLIPAVKCYGEERQDIDIVILGWFRHQPEFGSYIKVRDNNGDLQTPDSIVVHSLCIILEIKDHSPQHIRFEGSKVEARYGNYWSSVTQQTEEEKYSLKKYLERNGQNSPWIVNLIWLRNIPKDGLPKVTHNILGSSFTWNEIMNRYAMGARAFSSDGGWHIDAFGAQGRIGFENTTKILLKKIEPTALDRKRMDRICAGVAREDITEAMGKSQIVLWGRGGTGKTFLLLQLAWQMYSQRCKRILFLTFNRALASDLRRTSTLLGMQDDPDIQTIKIQTVHSFLYWLLVDLGLNPIQEVYLEEFSQYEHQLVEYLESGALLEPDFKELPTKDPFRFDWDFVFIDEAQDWPQAEKRFIRLIYPPEKIIIADGVDQFVRGQKKCDWEEGLHRNQSKRFTLETGWRMKANLARFANLFADSLGLSGWSVLANEQANGGQIVIVEGDYRGFAGLHKDLMDKAISLGNGPIDCLACVPAYQTDTTENSCSSNILNMFTQANQPVWDGTKYDIRCAYPTSINQLRIVYYESCRGLEGWVVFNLGLDDFYDQKLNLWQSNMALDRELIDDPALPYRFAARWLMIPITRAIDTIVIQVGLRPSRLKDILRGLASNECKDFTVWYKQ